MSVLSQIPTNKTQQTTSYCSLKPERGNLMRRAFQTFHGHLMILDFYAIYQ